MPYLFLIHIGPVQDFIASARRTRDLAFGSWLLSELARAAAHEIVRQNGLESLIFPAPPDAAALAPEAKTFIVANKIVARVQQSPADLALLVRKAVETRLEAIRDKAYTGVPFSPEARTIAEAQVKDLIEFFWVALPFEEQQYLQTRKQGERLMAARKNTRTFQRVTWGTSALKSSITGELESVIPRSAYPSSPCQETRGAEIFWPYITTIAQVQPNSFPALTYSNVVECQPSLESIFRAPRI